MSDEQWTIARCRAIAEQHLSGLGHRWAHATAVGEHGQQLAKGGLIADHIACAAWVHDIGYAPALRDTGCHPIDGAEYLARSGAPQNIVALVAHHTGAAWEADQRGLSHRWAQLPRPDTDDLDILTLLDLTRGPQGQPTDPRKRIAEILTRYPTSHPVHRAVTLSRPHLLAAADRARAILEPDCGRSGADPAGAFWLP